MLTHTLVFLQNINICNGTLLKTDAQTRIMNSGTIGNFPNGDQKWYIGWFDDEDEKIAAMTFFSKNRFHTNSLTGSNFR